MPDPKLETFVSYLHFILFKHTLNKAQYINLLTRENKFINRDHLHISNILIFAKESLSDCLLIGNFPSMYKCEFLFSNFYVSF